MRRAALGMLLGFAAGLASLSAAKPALADCTEEIRSLRTKLAAVKEEARRQELQRLVEKAEKDDKAGRAKLCDQTVQQALALLK